MGPVKIAHYEPPYLDLHCLQIQLLSLLMLYALNMKNLQNKA